MIEKIKSYTIAFLTGAVLVLAIITLFLLKNVKPVINADSYIESLSNSIKKLKVNGESNTVDTVLSTSITPEAEQPEQPKRKKFLFIFNRRKA
jgi:hypothetical protein